MAERHVYVIGDSISLHYFPKLQDELRAEFVCERKGNAEEYAAAVLNLDIPKGANCGDSDRVLAYLRYLRSTKPVSADYLLVNCGLHDIKTDMESGEKQVPLERYRENLTAIVTEARAMVPGFVWVNTTPVFDEIHNNYPDTTFHRHGAAVCEYNAVAHEIMRGAGVPVIDLYTFSLSLLPGGFMDHVHYDEPSRVKQAVFIAGSLRRLDEEARG